MNEPHTFVSANRAMVAVVSAIAPDQWGMRMPADFASSYRPEIPTMREVINYHAYDDAWVPDMLAGRTMDEVGRDKFDGDLLGDDPKGSYRRIAATASEAAAATDDLDRVVHCSFGDYSVGEYFWQVNWFRTIRAHDLAKVIGCPLELPPELVQAVFDQIAPNADLWRTLGVFGPAVPVADGAPLLDRLLAMCGRQPDSV
jgi:uncharacterized protein (TIGR03086 family)